MFNFPGRLFDSSGFMARWSCGTWSSGLGWLHISSDIAIWGAYTAIPIVLAYFVVQRRDVPFSGIFWLFCLFIYSCGIGHLIEAFIFWYPVYRLSGLVKFITAIASWLTVIAVIPIIPKALALPRLALINTQLEKEIAQRNQAQNELHAKAAELVSINDQLEHFNRLATGREHRMIELKQQVNQLAAELGREAPYKLDFLGSSTPEA